MAAKKPATSKKDATVRMPPAAKKKPSAENDTAGVDAYMRLLEHPLKAEMEAVRAIVRGANPRICERVKWNAPSFFCGPDMAAFNPRAEKFVHLILIYPEGRGMGDGGILEGAHRDRREVRFHDLADVQAKADALRTIVNDWVAVHGG